MPKVRVVGQGVDVAKFRPEAVEKTGDLVSVGRLSPIKGLDRMIEALAECNSRFGTSYRLDIHGPLPQRDREYVEHLRDLIRRLQLSHLVSLHPSVSHDSVPGILNRARVYLNFSRTALDRAVVEAMACGLPVISTNPCVKEILPPALQELLFVGWDDADGQAERIHRALSWDEASLAETSRAMREIVARDHSFEALIGKLLKEMGVC
jgi:glycosyltransferase involved in cell wall biosynthesis